MEYKMFSFKESLKKCIRFVFAPIIRRFYAHVDHRVSLFLTGGPVSHSSNTTGMFVKTGNLGASAHSLSGATHGGGASASTFSVSKNNMMLHSIYLHPADIAGFPDILPPRVSANIDSFKQAHPGFSHHLYGHDALVAFLEDKFGKEVTETYHRLVPKAYKADLARYCLLYVHGGVYADLACHFWQPIVRQAPTKLHIFRDGFNLAPWIVSNAIIAAPRNLPLFEEVIKNIIRHCHENYYGFNPLCPTGPNLFGRCIATHSRLDELEAGEAIKINKNPSTPSLAYIPPNGEILAVSCKLSTGLRSLGAPFHEDYNDIYAKKGIYKSIYPVK